MSSQLQVSGEAKIRDIQGPVVANSGVITALDGAASQYVRGDGTLADFPTSSGGGSSVSYYLNSSVSQGTIGGVAYRELSKEPIIGAGTNIAISSNGYVANYITDANDPDVVLIPGGNFNCEFYFSVNNNTGNPFTYAELYKYDGTTFTLLGSSVGVPEYITQGTNIAPYYFAIPVATATLALTDRLAIRIYVNVDGRTVTLHTENGHLCQVVTTLSKGMVSLNNLTDQSQFLAVGTSGTNFAIVSSGDTHTFNLPIASATNTGKLSSTDWSTFNAKQPAGNYVTLDTTQTITAAKTFTENPIINGTGTNSAYTILQSAGTNKWRIGNNYAAGVNTFDIFAYDNTTTPLSINSNGAMTLSANVTTTGAQFVQNGFYLTNANGGYLAGYTLMYGKDDGINFALRNGTGGASFIFPSANSYAYTFPAATGTLALTSNLSAYLPLTGGTLTGALAGTTATFSGNMGVGTASPSDRLNVVVSANGNVARFDGPSSGLILQTNATTTDIISYGGTTPAYRTLNFATSATTALSIATSGAATFSSSVAANGVMSLGNDGTYGSTYKTLGLTGNTDGTHRIFGGTSDDLYIAAATSRGINFWTNGVTSTRMYISSGGNVGIGTSSPTANLQISGLSGLPATSGSAQRGALRIANSSNIAFDFGTVAAGQAWLQVSDANNYASNFALLLNPNGGNVGIGTSSPASYGGFTTLNINNATNGGLIDLLNNGTRVGTFFNTSSDVQIGSITSVPFIFYTANTERMRITSGGYIVTSAVTYGNTSGGAANMFLFGAGDYGIGRSVSSAKYKTQIEDVEESFVSNIYKMRPIWYRSICERDRKDWSHFGFVAEEIAEIEPRLVHWDKDEEGNLVAEGVQYDRITVLLVAEMQKMRSEIQEQQTQIEELSNKIVALESK